MSAHQITIEVNKTETVSGLLLVPGLLVACFVLAHGAGAGMTHPFMTAVAEGLHARRMATLRYQFPYMEHGSKRPDRPALAHATVRAAVASAARLAPAVPLIAGGKSFGARMTSQAQAQEPLPGVRGLAFLGFPLHPAGKPSDDRAAHLSEVRLPMLFLQGTRDALADGQVLAAVLNRLSPVATPHLIEQADHSFHVPVRSGTTDRQVLDDVLDTLVAWASGFVGVTGFRNADEMTDGLARTVDRLAPRAGQTTGDAGSHPSRAMQPAKIQHLEGLRGIAAVQVVLLHFVTGFLPGTAEHAAPPLQVLWDGHTAVYVFFLISGAVLTKSFARGGRWPRQVAKRLVRLGLPITAAAVIALLLLAAMPDAHIAAARLTGSGWLAMDSSAAPTLTHLLRESTLDSLLLGYREYTLFTPIADRLPLLEHALNAPSWSLHLELYGSLLLLGLVLLRERAPRVHLAAVAICAVMFGTHPMFLFVLGHLLANQSGKPPKPLIGAGLIALGLAMSATKNWALLEAVREPIARFAPAAAPNLYQFQSQLAAVALFAGVLLNPVAQRLLSFCHGLGRLSFSIYLLHFPILFTLACAAFIRLAGGFHEPVPVVITFIGFAAIVWLAAEAFERLIDRPSVVLSRRIDPRPQLAPA